LQLSGTNKLAKLTTTPQPIIYGTVGGEKAALLTYGASINGVGVVRIKGADASAPSASGPASGTVNGTGLSLSGNRFALAIGRLPEGKNTISIWVRDRGGNTVKKSFTSFVDTQSVFGTSQLTVGAIGGDVKQLQERLGTLRLWKGATTRTYNEKTAKAVRRYQKRYRLTQTGNVDAATLRKMVGRIDISLNRRTLTLYRDGRPFKTFRVAIGMPAYPTPTGNYRIVNMQKNPTWLPPDSPWAKGLGPVPPGPGNPLGTRWIGTSAPAVGIHGSPASWSIGSAASHGCLRMHISENEKLYELVVVGMPVDIHN
jgi:lipoprotein-anchoring transpeptidase ErfK/SrfK